MPTTIKIDTRSNAAKRFLAYVKTLSFAQVEEEKATIIEKKPNAETAKLLRENRNKRGTKFKDAADMFDKMGIDV